MYETALNPLWAISILIHDQIVKIKTSKSRALNVWVCKQLRLLFITFDWEILEESSSKWSNQAVLNLDSWIIVISRVQVVYIIFSFVIESLNAFVGFGFLNQNHAFILYHERILPFQIVPKGEPMGLCLSIK